MSSRSIVDRVLLFAAAICAAGLVWQLTVLMTSKGHGTAFPRIETMAAAAVQPAPETQQPQTSSVRIVYPDATPAKMIGKATDTADGAPMTSPTPMTAGSVIPISTTAFAPTKTAVASMPAVMSGSPNPSPALSAVPASKTPASAEEAQDDDSSASPAKMAAVAPPAETDPAVASPSADPVAKTAPKQGGLNINQASIDALNHLRGGGRIGQAIASHRPYHSVEDLLKKRVVRRNVYDQIKDQLAAE